jgi:hypothetical protein
MANSQGVSQRSQELVKEFEEAWDHGTVKLSQNDRLRLGRMFDALMGDAEGAARAKTILLKGLKYHEHDGHDMPKRVSREALVALGVPVDDQP